MSLCPPYFWSLIHLKCSTWSNSGIIMHLTITRVSIIDFKHHNQTYVRSSQVFSHPKTSLAQCCLTSVITQELVHPTRPSCRQHHKIRTAGIQHPSLKAVEFNLSASNNFIREIRQLRTGLALHFVMVFAAFISWGDTWDMHFKSEHMNF